MKPGAYALDCHGSILHRNPDVLRWGPSLIDMMKDLELQMLGMVEIRIGSTYYAAQYQNPCYLYQDWNAVLNQKFKEFKANEPSVT